MINDHDPAATGEDPRCEWSVDADLACVTSCKERHQLAGGGLLYNGFRFCPFCGRRISEPGD
jgi:hypothetical protein